MDGRVMTVAVGCALLACSGRTTLDWGNPPPRKDAAGASESAPQRPVETAGQAGVPAATGGGAGSPGAFGASGGAVAAAGTGGALESGGGSEAGTAGSGTEPSSQAGAGGTDEMAPEFPAHGVCGPAVSEYRKRFCPELDTLSIELQAIEDEGGDGSMSPGEQGRLVFKLTNNGFEISDGPCVGVAAAAPGLTVLESYNPAPHLYGLLPGQSAQVKTLFRVEPSVASGARIPIQAWLDIQAALCPNGHDVEFELRVGP